jgi:lipoprotein-anchoring transpeptidase ErfK/SrfK
MGVRMIVVLVALAVSAAACGSGEEQAAASSTTAGTLTTPTTSSPPTTSPPETTTTTAPFVLDTIVVEEVTPIPAWTAAVVDGRTPVYASPNGDPVRMLDATTILGTRTVVRVLHRSDGWLHVELPGRPQGATGYLRESDTEVFSGERTVEIDLSDRTLVVWEDGVAVLETPVAVGKAQNPTPTGTFFVTDAVKLTRPSGPWGPFAFGLSARSESITEFNGGDGIIGIHGTNNPSSIGCVRVPNETILELAQLVRVGATVTIRA